MIRKWQALLFLLLLLAPWAQAAPAHADAGPGAPILFSETGHTLAYTFRTFYETLNGALVFGLPLTEVFIEDGQPTQYFERARLVLRADLGQVEVADLGRWASAGREGEPAFQPAGAAAEGAIAFETTGHTLDGSFREFFTQYGGRAIFGLPISEAFTETSQQDGQTYLVQYFERARFELHPELQWPATVALAPLGRSYLAAHPAPETASQPVDDAGQAWQSVRPTHVSVPRIGVDVAVEERGSTMGAWDVPATDVGHFWPIGALPGTAGNIIMGGHSDFPDKIFNHLPEIQVGDEVLVTTDGQPRRYVVTELLTVLPRETWVLETTASEQLTLITCVPFGVNDHRLIVHAVPA
ncbi:MAG: sortase [Kouleothrix sp.]|nr:sortase [Kouleothrix sp.]